ncbi:RagB/SusD family nutrient uptake outer membrane protein [Sphingobacterium sp. BIGb0165]|uniref:RagB/SusD family nutrient uptake outer membrane protein n=1 Tax=Sphingobacterium sp. BIGb0165 TaxID=2940615 RepID=UPI00216A44E9|nr:RagB/SusD family nutrient uptake outer membrane protein [Sphingobacterium sp. BIGb0165]MCS4226428.1 tetratricopeptide (TPR) repeat protein [Sphingobacterium sp. BIGb0165]
MKLIKLIFPLILLLSGCSKYLDLKPDNRMAVPQTLADCELLLNDYSTMNTGFSSLGESGTDDFFIESGNYEALTDMDEKNAYIWSNEPVSSDFQWQSTYKVVFVSNQILAVLNDLPQKTGNDNKKVLGAAHFYRAFAFHQIAEVFCLPYEESKASSTPGIPIRTMPSLEGRSLRSDLRTSYEQIIADYKIAAANLPVAENKKGRPARAAAYAALARVYLGMQRYEEAYKYADSCLRLQARLIDFNTLNTSDEFPIQRFNTEVLFPATTGYSDLMQYYYARVSPELYESYADADLRKVLFFEPSYSDESTYGITASYDNYPTGIFIGLTTSEAYLIRAEAAARLGRNTVALVDLNTLLKNRMETAAFQPVTEDDPLALLKLILLERRKELVSRGRRWADLKRLNQDSRFAKELTRSVNGKTFTLKPGSLNYAVLIPQKVIDLTGMEQNRR